MRVTAEMSSHATGAEAQSHAKLADAAQQFEAMMLQELLKPLQAGQDGWGGKQQNDDAGSDTVSSLGVEAVAKAIAQRGGLGIAKQVIRQVTQESQRIAGKKPCGY